MPINGTLARRERQQPPRKPPAIVPGRGVPRRTKAGGREVHQSGNTPCPASRAEQSLFGQVAERPHHRQRVRGVRPEPVRLAAKHARTRAGQEPPFFSGMPSGRPARCAWIAARGNLLQLMARLFSQRPYRDPGREDWSACRGVRRQRKAMSCQGRGALPNQDCVRRARGDRRDCSDVDVAGVGARLGPVICGLVPDHGPGGNPLILHTTEPRGRACGDCADSVRSHVEHG